MKDFKQITNNYSDVCLFVSVILTDTSTPYMSVRHISIVIIFLFEYNIYRISVK